jgi:beta-glucosidase
LAIPDEHELADAVIYAWYSGCEGGNALADVLWGDVAPSGRLPITVPRRTEDLPKFNDYSMRGRTYRFATIEPLYPFGFGLSYAKIRYANLRTSATTLGASETLSVELTLENQSARTALETAQCYLIPPAKIADAPRAILVDFAKVSVLANGSTKVSFTLLGDAFRQIDERGERRWIAGDYQIVVSAASPGKRAQALGAPEPVSGQVTLV